MIDFDLVRAYYFDPPPPDALRVPSDEELIARYERRRFERCILRLGDPVAEGLGPHGSMIGGPGKPITIHYERAERAPPLSTLYRSPGGIILAPGSASSHRGDNKPPTPTLAISRVPTSPACRTGPPPHA